MPHWQISRVAKAAAFATATKSIGETAAKLPNLKNKASPHLTDGEIFCDLIASPTELYINFPYYCQIGARLIS